MIKTNLWSKEWPTEPGFYWFWGCLYKGDIKNRHVRYTMVVCKKSSNSTFLIANGAFLYKSEFGDGWWQRAVPPSIEGLEIP